jgi:hypothetical protein
MISSFRCHPAERTPDIIHEAVGFPVSYDQATQPSWEWMKDHGAWFKLGYVSTDDLGLVVPKKRWPDVTKSVADIRFEAPKGRRAV